MSEPTEPKKPTFLGMLLRGELGLPKPRLPKDKSLPQNTLAPCPQEKWTHDGEPDSASICRIYRGTKAKEFAGVNYIGNAGSTWSAEQLCDAHNASLAPCPIKDEGEETELLPDAKIIELAERMCLPGHKCDHLSASEVMEVAEWILGLPEASPATTGKGTMELHRRIEIDFPGQVYGCRPRLLFRGEDGEISEAREATVEEYFAWQTLHQTKWIPVSERLPEVCKAVIGYAERWVDSEYNEMGMRECFRNDDCWQSAAWNNTQDCWDAEQGEPDCWSPFPEAPSEGRVTDEQGGLPVTPNSPPDGTNDAHWIEPGEVPSPALPLPLSEETKKDL